MYPPYKLANRQPFILRSALTKPNERHDKPGKPGKRPGKFAKKESNSRQIPLFYIYVYLPGFGNI